MREGATKTRASLIRRDVSRLSVRCRERQIGSSRMILINGTWHVAVMQPAINLISRLRRETFVGTVYDQRDTCIALYNYARFPEVSSAYRHVHHSRHGCRPYITAARVCDREASSSV